MDAAMITPLTLPGLTLLFLGVVVGLGIALVWMMWELEQTAKQAAKARGTDNGSRLR
jgi:predicted negative regulator of RcsB-dependent stress response